MATVLISGGTGMIGTALTAALLNRNDDVIILTRNAANKPSHSSRLQYAEWNPQAGTIDKAAVLKADYIINLTGAAVADKRWTSKRKNEIIESRTQSGALLVKALQENANTVKAVISASAIGWYGPNKQNQNTVAFTEADPAYDDFLGQTCKQWEESIEPVRALNKRLVKLRIGIVLSNNGGAMKEFLKPLRFGIASILGSGKQVISWIHIDDLARIILHAMDHDSINGVYNAVAPNPVTNKNFVITLARELKGRFYIPVYVPSVILKLMLGEMSIEVLKSAAVSANKIISTGFIFQYPSVQAAIRELCSL